MARCSSRVCGGQAKGSMDSMDSMDGMDSMDSGTAWTAWTAGRILECDPLQGEQRKQLKARQGAMGGWMTA